MLNWLQQDPWGFLNYMLYRAPAVLLALSAHEWAHGYIALRCGDDTAKQYGRLSLNPLAHLDPWGTISMFFLGFGWAKPVPVNPYKFKNGYHDDLKVSLAGICANLLLFLLATLVSIGIGCFLYSPDKANKIEFGYWLSFTQDGFWAQLMPANDALLGRWLSTPWLIPVQRFFLQFSLVNLGLALFNLLPIPPLDGFHVFNDLVLKGRFSLPPQAMRIIQIGLMMVLLSTDFIGKLIQQGIYQVQNFILPLFLKAFGLS